jgi:uncharacterized protein
MLMRHDDRLLCERSFLLLLLSIFVLRFAHVNRKYAKRKSTGVASRPSIVVRLHRRDDWRQTSNDLIMSLVIRESQIHSYGCYTTRPIRKGRLVVEYVGERLSNAQADDLYDDVSQTYLFGLNNRKQVVDGYGVAAFINHSCRPNCETDQIRGKIWVISLRDILEGEELTYDYNLFDGEEDAPCFCGAKRCRGSLYSREHLRKLQRIRASQLARTAALEPGILHQT